MDSKRNRKKLVHNLKIEERCVLQHNKNKMRKLVRKSTNLSEEEQLFIDNHQWLYNRIVNNLNRRSIKEERKKEQLDPPELLARNLDTLAVLFKHYKGRVLVYTGAGISTSADIPDYRGPAGKWTVSLKTSSAYSPNSSCRFDMSEASFARPTIAHMGIRKLAEEGYIKYVVSQNVDGLHMRSGLSRDILSEIHGNIFVELCPDCEAFVIRNFDTTERTGQRRHTTGRTCPKCPNSGQLIDSIVHFGEKSKDLGEAYLYNWDRIAKVLEPPHERKLPHLIVCLGTSLQVLKHYSILWPPVCKLAPPQQVHDESHEIPNSSLLVIVNLQWTPKDKQAALKLHSSCDSVISGLLTRLGLTADTYQPDHDPINLLHTPLTQDEWDTKTRPTIDFT